MRVALLQLDLTGKSRATGYLRLAAAIDAAADAAPGPDLIVLSGGADLIGASARTVTAASLDGFQEFLSLKAREWGVFLAAGLTRLVEEEVSAQTVVFDPDGDVVLRSQDARTSTDSERAPEPFWCSSVGRLGVVDPEAVNLPEGGQPEDATAPLMIWPTAGAVTAHQRGTLAALRDDVSVGAGRHWAVVVPASNADTGHEIVSFVTTSVGETIAVAPNGLAMMLTAEVPVEIGAGE